MEPLDVAVVGAEDRHLGDGVTDSEQVLDGALATKDVALLVLCELGFEDADDTEAAVGDLVLRVLAHDHDPFAETGLELFDQLAADHQTAVVSRIQKTTLGHIVGDKADAAFAVGFDPDQGDTAGVALRRDNRRHPHPRRPGHDLWAVQDLEQFAARRFDHVRDRWVVAKVRVVDLNVAGQDADAVPDHVVDHAAHQRGHEDHRPHTDDDCGQHDQGSAMVAPQIAPGKTEDNS